MPYPVQRAIMPLVGGFFHLALPSARRHVEANLRRVLGDKGSLDTHVDSYRLFVNYAQSVANMYSLYLGQSLPVEPQFNGRDRLVAARALGRGMIIVTGHLGFSQ